MRRSYRMLENKEEQDSSLEFSDLEYYDKILLEAFRNTPEDRKDSIVNIVESLAEQWIEDPPEDQDF